MNDAKTRFVAAMAGTAAVLALAGCAATPLAAPAPTVTVTAEPASPRGSVIPTELADKPGAISRDDVGSQWPLKVPYAVLKCRDIQAGGYHLQVVTLTTPSGREYAVNGTAKSHTSLPDINPVWAGATGGLKKDISPVLDKGLDLCRQEPADDPGTLTVPNAVGMDYQSAQDLWRSQGLVVLPAEDATGAHRMPMIDSGWVVLGQDPKPGTQATDGDPIVALVKKYSDD